jgi:hypothetical protein
MISCRIKAEVVPLHAMDGAWGERIYTKGGERSASRRGRALPPDKEPPVPTVQEAGWAAEPVWTQRLE